MLTYSLDKNCEKPLYLQLYENIKADIESGAVAGGVRLPSKRALSVHLNISVITVQTAYFLLTEEGYIFTRERSGYFACEVRAGGRGYIQKSSTISYAEAATKIDTRLDMGGNASPDKQFPFSVWAKLMRRAISENYDGLFCRIDIMGLECLRKAVSDFLYRYRGMHVNPDNILIGAGTEFLYGSIARLIGRDKIYAVEDPGYKKLTHIYEAEGLKLEHIPVDEQGIDTEILSGTGADVAHVSPSHHFPTGTVMPAVRRTELLKWAYGGERYIIEDEYDSEFRFSGKPLPTVFSTGGGEKTIYINTFSKTISPSLRISYTVLPAVLAERYRSEFGFYSCSVPALEQYTLAEFVDGGYYERHLARMKKYYKNKRDEVLNVVRDTLPASVYEIKEEKAGLHFLIKLNTHKPDGEIKAAASERGVNLVFLSEYSVTPIAKYNSTVLINYSDIAICDIKKIAAVVSEIIKR